MERIYNQINAIYIQYSTRNPPKYLKYLAIAFGSIGLSWFARNLFWTLSNKLKKYPPGPLGIPFLGCLLSFGGKPRQFLCSIPRKYGPITFFPLLSTNNIFISDSKALRKLFINEKIFDRPPFVFRPIQSFTELNGQKWIDRRKYASATVFDLTNTSFILSHVKQSIHKYVNPTNNKLWYPLQDMYFISFNNILAATFDKIVPKNDPFIAKYSQQAHKIMDHAGLSMLIDFIITSPDWLRWKTIFNVQKEADDMMIEWMRNNGFNVNVEENILSRNDTESITTNKVYIDFLISKLNENEVTVGDIIADIQSICVAGIDTTSAASEYGFLLLAKYPDVQEKVYNELQAVIKKNNLKEFDFKILNELHIFRAFIHEVLRISSVAGGLPHYTNKDHMVEIDGKRMIIPKDTICHKNIYFMNKLIDWNNNEILKEENDMICLDYWIDDENGKFKMNDNWILFGVGKRNCVGQTLAMKAMYAIFGIMINKYKFIKDGDEMIIKQKWGPVLAVEPPIGVQVVQR